MDTQQFEAMLSDAEIRLRRLKVLYDQWFVGIERTEPAIPKKELEDLLVRLRREQPTNTALKFRLQQIVQRHVTFTQYWRRIARQIEEGTFKRDLLRARSRKKRSPEDDTSANFEIDVELELDVDMDLDAALADAVEASERVAPAAASPAAALAPPAVARGAPIALPEAAGRAVGPGAPAKLPVPPAVGGPKPPPPAAAGAKPGAGALPAVPPAAAAAAAAVVRQIKGPAAPPAPAGATPAKPPPAAGLSRPQPPAAAKPQPAAVPKVAAAASAQGNGGQPALSSEDVQRIYSKYVAARKQNAERTDNVKLDNIEKTLRGMLPSLEKKHAGKKIDFEVVVKDGKVALKPVAK